MQKLSGIMGKRGKADSGVSGFPGDYVVCFAENAGAYFLMRVHDVNALGRIQSVVPPRFYSDDDEGASVLSRHAQVLGAEPINAASFAKIIMVSGDVDVVEALSEFSEKYAAKHRSNSRAIAKGVAADAPRWRTMDEAQADLYDVVTKVTSPGTKRRSGSRNSQD